MLAEDKSQQWLDGALDFCVKVCARSCVREPRIHALLEQVHVHQKPAALS